jgi:hypothetical protein
MVTIKYFLDTLDKKAEQGTTLLESIPVESKDFNILLTNIMTCINISANIRKSLEENGSSDITQSSFKDSKKEDKDNGTNN